VAFLLPGTAGADADLLVEVAREVGLGFVHDNGQSGRLYFVEMMGPGAALADFDGDGDLDAFFPQGHPLDPAAPAGGLPSWPRDRLFRNDLEVLPNGARRLRFTDVSAASGIEAGAVGYGYGAAVGDFDDDGRPDLYVTNWGENRLYRNAGGLRFRDVTEPSGTGEPGWGTSATFFDLDGDGRLDLYVANYVAYDLASTVRCFAASSAPDYCGPLSFRPQPDRLFGNRGDGSFEPLPLAPGDDGGNGLGVVATDADRDGRLDLYVANDQQENYLWINREGRRFSNEALLAGAAVDREGRPQASMGVAVADHDGDGDEDLFLTHLRGETNTLYRSDGRGNFEDVTLATGLGPPSFPMTGFGTWWFDLDADNRLDLFVANGTVHRVPAQMAAGSALPLAERPQLFGNRGDGTYEDLSGAAGKLFQTEVVGRGAAFGDVDNDGDTDILVAVNGGPAMLLENRTPRRYPHWLGLRLVTARGRDAYGARVEIRLAGGEASRGQAPRAATPRAATPRTETLFRWVRADGSYCSANDPRILVAVPAAGAVERVLVTWLGGRQEDFAGLALDRYQTLAEGTGLRVAP
jgi:hypothetical protein